MRTDADLAALIAYCRSIDWSRCEPRRNLSLRAWQEDWDDHLAMLDTFIAEGPCGAPDEVLAQGDGFDACLQWENTAQVASTMLRQALDRGLPPQGLRHLYLQVLEVWRGYAHWLRTARSAGHAVAEVAIRTETDQYQFALQLLALGVLLDAPDDAPAIVEELLHFRTDRLLDYLSAGAHDQEEASERCLHPQPFEGLNDFFEQYGEVHAAPLLPYLQQHYTQFFALPMAQQKRHPRLTGPQAWGWWALEVSALVVLYDLDDQALREHPHYPADLVDFALGLVD